MKEFISHIDYLIQKHDCVIIPDFGGFVLNHEGASFSLDGSILPPKVTVGFNPELRYNDGLLAESYMSVYSVTYDVACKQIEEAVNRLNTILGMRHPIQVGRLGKLSLDKNNKLLFVPSANLSIFHPETFGLSAVNIKRLSDIEKDNTRAKRRSLFQRSLAGVGAAAAAVLIFFIASTPVSETPNIQKSSFFTDWVSSSAQIQEANSSTVKVDEQNEIQDAEILSESNESNISNKENSLPEIISEQTIENTVPLVVDAQEEKSVSTGNYFVIIGSANSASEANNLLAKFKRQGIEHADVITSGKRSRIYVESFTTRSEAENYLVDFKKNNRGFSDAWVHFQE